LTDAFQSEVDKGAIPGAVVLIARKGKVAYFEAIGFQNRENKEPMRTDAIFRIASMSKPITSVAVMMLVEEGRIQLLDPVSAICLNSRVFRWELKNSIRPPVIRS
jgi:CubicO group peptidase (beta-lactamase class C family)